MTPGFGRRTRKAAEAGARLDEEAAGILEARVAEGRPGPEVFAAAADSQAAKGLPADAWYRPDGDDAEPAAAADARTRPPAPSRRQEPVGAAFTLRVVHLPLAAGSVPAATAGTLGAVADATR